MKKQILLVATLLLLINFSNAAILRCNNNPLSVGPNVYADAQQAHDAASAGDTIHLEPHGSYGTLTLSKPLVIISTGYFLTLNSGLQANPLEATLDNIICGPGSENSIISCSVSYHIYVQASDITLKNARAHTVYFQASTTYNLSIKQSVINSLCGSGCGGNSWNNLILENSYIDNIFNNSPANSSAIINQCIVNSSSFSIENSVITNSIFFANTVFDNCNAHNNICGGFMGGNFTGTNNFPNVDMTNVLAQWPTFQGDDYQLLPSYSNQTIGMYAGSNPYKPGGIPAIPTIYQLDIPENTSDMKNLQIQVSTKSNN